MPKVPKETIQEFDVKLESDQEWHSKPMRLREGTVVTLTATGSADFYAGLFQREVYVRMRAQIGGFDFSFGSDLRSFTHRYQIESTDDYYLVFRVGVFSRTQTIHVRLIFETPG